MNSLLVKHQKNHSKIGCAASVAGYHYLSELVREHSQVFILTESSLDALLCQDYLSQYRDDCFCLADHELMPYDSFSVSGFIAGQRNHTIYQLLTRKKFVIISSVHAALYKIPPKSFYLQNCVSLKVGQQLNLEGFIEQLTQAGYDSVSEVHEIGQFAKRGSLCDFFPAASTYPVRLEFFDDRIESIRTFCPQEQSTIEVQDSFQSVPLAEYINSRENTTRALKNFKLHTQKISGSFLQTLRKGAFPSGFQFFLPMLYPKVHSVFDYLSAHTQLYALGDVHEKLKSLGKNIEERQGIAQSHFGFTPYSLDQIALKELPDSFHTQLFADAYDHLPNLQCEVLENMASKDTLNVLKTLKENYSDKKLLIGVSQPEKSSSLIQKIKSVFHEKTLNVYSTIEQFLKSDDKVALISLSFAGAFHFEIPKTIILSESWIYSYKPQPKIKRKSKASGGFEQQAQLKPGSLVVHQDHGIALYQGLKLVHIAEITQEMNELLFAQNDKLYVPLDDLHLLSPYFSLEPESVELSKLGTNKWAKQKEKAYSLAVDQASELLALYAAREKSLAQSFSLTEDYEKFSSQFPYQETDDQLQVINQVLDDMCSTKPMDRLICGDVGFGKTEVAMRAMFVAVSAGTQVALLSPTTLLAQQHYESLLARFEHWPVQIELLARAGKQKDLLEKVEKGQIDILVGTHKIIQNTVRYKKLGLIVIDEEHRFGVAQKEQLKKMRSYVDVLCMTATPIPRTLSMSFHGLRDLSIIATPPERRLKVETMVYEQSDQLLVEAAQRELMRSGQIYYVHNDIGTIENQATKLRRLFPEHQVGVVHGSMKESEQERIMTKFYHQDCDILVGTTIIETGLDVPNANTIFISNAQNLGLAQLHQLRGRVGRSYHQAYAYLFIPVPLEKLPLASQYRLQAIYDNQELGAGFQLASSDLEIRGSGSLLGDKQSGHAQDIGLETFKKLLIKARRELSGEPAEINSDEQTQIELFLSCFIPEKQISCPFLRLKIYRQWQSAQSCSQLQMYRDLFIDRFGSMLPETLNKYHQCFLKIRAQALKVKKVKVSYQSLIIEFEKHFDKAAQLMELMKNNAKIISFKGPTSIVFKVKIAPEKRFSFVQKLFAELEQSSKWKIQSDDFEKSSSEQT